RAQTTQGSRPPPRRRPVQQGRGGSRRRDPRRWRRRTRRSVLRGGGFPRAVVTSPGHERLHEDGDVTLGGGNEPAALCGRRGYLRDELGQNLLDRLVVDQLLGDLRHAVAQLLGQAQRVEQDDGVLAVLEVDGGRREPLVRGLPD